MPRKNLEATTVLTFTDCGKTFTRQYGELLTLRQGEKIEIVGDEVSTGSYLVSSVNKK